MPPSRPTFGATNQPNTCRWCGQPLSVNKYHRKVSPDRSGYEGNKFFCRLSCGFLFGLWFAEHDYRLRRADTVTENTHEMEPLP
jgi:hypothetical protein